MGKLGAFAAGKIVAQPRPNHTRKSKCKSQKAKVKNRKSIFNGEGLRGMATFKPDTV
jgi:hypothetical protein